MSRSPKLRALLSVAALLLVASLGFAAPPPVITRVSATLNGVIAPRGFFNILVPLSKIQGATAAKLDLKISRITIDFAPGATVTQKEMRQVIVDAGYRPGPIAIVQLPEGGAAESGSGWIRIKHPKTRNPIAHWIEENF